MRSYYAHLEAANTTVKEAIVPKPIFRASAIFPAIQLPGINSRILFMGYWMLKRNIKEISAVISLRSQSGKLLSRTVESLIESKAYRIELKEHLARCGISPNESFLGTLEVEFYSTVNLVFPFPAVVINYYGPSFSSVVHTAQRIYNDFDDMQNNSKTHVAESGFNIYANDQTEPFIHLINGVESVANCKLKFDFYNTSKEILSHTFDLGDLAPYQLISLFPARDLPLKEFLKGDIGSCKLDFQLKWVFPRLVVGNYSISPPSFVITHSYYDCSQAEKPSDYWLQKEEKWHPASLMIPVSIEESAFTSVYLYPIYSPSHFWLNVEFYDQMGKCLGKKEKIVEVILDKQMFLPIPLKKICHELGIETNQPLAARIIADTEDANRIPCRIKVAVDKGLDTEHLPCNICTNLQPFNPAWENKTKSFKWAPILTDQPKSPVWLMNSSPAVNYQKEENIELTFFREEDTQTLKRTVKIPPHGFIIITPDDQDVELKQFLNGQIGWFTAICTNPYTTTYYFAENPSGVVGGDHGF